MTPDMLLMLAWMASNTSYKTDIREPEVRYETSSDLCRMNAVPLLECKKDTVHGAYNPYTNIIRISTDVNADQQRAAMFHELFHAVQVRNRVMETTPHACMELEAHTVTNKWLAEQFKFLYDEGHTTQETLDAYRWHCESQKPCDPNQ